jgi:hypothetical protein
VQEKDPAKTFARINFTILLLSDTNTFAFFEKIENIGANPECCIVKEQMSSGLDDVCGLTDRASKNK